MTADPTRVPTWGVLVRAPIEEVRRILRPLAEKFDWSQFMYRTSGPWTAVFYMEPGSTGDLDAAIALKDAGCDPVYHFDFNRYEYWTSRWDGASWEQDRDPAYVLGDVGLAIPGWDQPDPPLDPSIAAVTRDVSILEGMTEQEARELVPTGVRVQGGPRGALVYDPDVALQSRLWRVARNRVFEIEFYPKSGNFWFRIMKGDDCLGTFRPGQTRTWDGTPFLADVDGEISPERIVEMFGLERSFLEPLEGTQPREH